MWSEILNNMRRIGEAISSWIGLAEDGTGIPFWQITLAVVGVSIVIRLIVGPMIGGFSYKISENESASKVDHLVFQGNKVYSVKKGRK